MGQHDDGAAQAERFRKAMEATTLENMDELHALADGTGNPLYTWKALSMWFDMNEKRARAGSDWLAMPDWCLSYLAIVSRRLHDLTEGKDYMETPTPYGKLPSTWDSVKRAHRRKAVFSPAEARKRALHALGLKRNGWDAFERARKLDEQEEDAFIVDALCFNGLSKKAAIEAVLDLHGSRAEEPGSKHRVTTEARSVHKRIAAVHRARMPKPR